MIQIKWDAKSNAYKAIEEIAVKKYGNTGDSLLVRVMCKYECEKEYREGTYLLADDREDFTDPPKYVWEYDWWEGEQDVLLVAIAPVSEIDLPEKWDVKDPDFGKMRI